ncbi:3-oxoadipate enol-lactonase [Phenylobacterium sp. LjRoot225]|uniref:3-oxoadipate enol-lactonase n=1 Tax=Phenylobacterium sp. LjRoot225 TaxID=3342285 RepID=UPI003ECD864D
MRLMARAADGCRLVGEAHGPAEAPPLLFLNSVGCDRRLWEPQVAALSEKFRCLVFDARGHGESGAPDGDYAIAQLGEDALTILGAAEVERTHLCGLSLGGLVGQWLAVEAPDRVASLTLANTASRIGSREGWTARMELVRAQGLEGIAAAAMERFFSPAFRQAQPAVVAEWRRRLTATPTAGYAGCCAALRDADLGPVLERIAAPTLVIGGALDVATPPEQAVALAATIPGANLEILPAAHLSNLEQADAFTSALRMHLEAA